MPGIFNASIFNDAIFNTGVAEAAVTATPPVAAGGVRRRRYIMPDGTVLMATTQEAYEILRRYTEPVVATQATGREPRQRPAVRMEPIVLEKRDVRFIPATDTLPDTYQAVISEKFSFRPDPSYLQVQKSLNRMEEETIIALLM